MANLAKTNIEVSFKIKIHTDFHQSFGCQHLYDDITSFLTWNYFR